MEIENKNNPLVSVIASCYNQALFLLETLDSIKNQTYKNIQLIMWDDCSSDNSVELIEKWIVDNQVDCVFLKHEKNIGICKSLNEAFSYVKGKYLQMVAMDDILLPNKIERHVEILENSSEKDALVFTDAYLINEKSELHQNRFIAYHKKYLSFHSGNYYQILLERNFVPAMSILYKVSTLKEMNGWDENLMFEDYDMLLRIAKKYDFIFDCKISVKYRLSLLNFHKNMTDFIDINNIIIYKKHIEQDIAKRNIHRIIEKLYASYNKNLFVCKKIYFSDMNASNLLLKCIKYNIPYIFYRFINFIDRKLSKKYIFK